MSTTPHDATPKRPTIGLALGGGAARGFAHIGVLRTLIAKGLTPDIITGTSIGAVVGGCYAAGKLDDLESWARSLTRRNLLELPRCQFQRLGVARRRHARRQAHRRHRRSYHRQAPAPLCGDRDRNRHRPRNLDHARPAERCYARVLCAARHLSAGPARRALAGRRRAGQSGAGLGRACARRARRDRRQRQHRHVRTRHGDAGSGLGRTEPPIAARGRTERAVRLVRVGEKRQAAILRDRGASRHSRPLWSRPSTSCRTASRAHVLPATRRTC